MSAHTLRALRSMAVGCFSACPCEVLRSKYPEAASARIYQNEHGVSFSQRLFGIGSDVNERFLISAAAQGAWPPVLDHSQHSHATAGPRSRSR